MSEMPCKPEGCPPQGTPELAEADYFFYSSPSLTVDALVPEAVWELPWQKRKGTYSGRVEEPLAWSHSIFDNAEVLREAREIIPAFTKKTIAVIHLTEADGFSAPSDSPIGEIHFDWWCITVKHNHGGRVIEGCRNAA